MKSSQVEDFFIQLNCFLPFFIIAYIHTNQSKPILECCYENNQKYVPCKHLLKYYVGFIAISLLMGYT